MKRTVASIAAIAAFCVAGLWAIAQIEQARAPQLSSFMPADALLYIEAKDFSSLLNDWTSSTEKRTWLAGDDYQAFSRSHLFERLSQAQGEFSTTAGVDADGALLKSVAGTQSCLALYDIGNLEFLYMTRMSQHEAESTPLWTLRSRFEQRTEGAAQFFVRHDTQSGRTAAFAVLDGWLILGTREDLVAGALDRLQSHGGRSVADEAWYVDSIKEAAGPQGDLRMVLNLDKIVPSPYFRSYWVQENSTEMKQYASAVSDLYRSQQSYREDRVLLRKPGLASRASGDVSALASLAPANSDFYDAETVSNSDAVLEEMRNTLLEVKPAAVQSEWSAPPAPTDQSESAGSASMLDVRIDQAPVVVAQADPFESLSALLHSAQPRQILRIGATGESRETGFVGIRSGMIVAAEQPLNLPAVQNAIRAALQPQLTAGSNGLNWVERAGKSGSYSALDGRVPLYIAVRENRLYCADDESLMEQMLAPAASVQNAAGATYVAVFRHGQREQRNFKTLFTRLDKTGNDANAVNTEQGPPFFSHNVESLSEMFASVDQETVSERDEGAKVLQTVSYSWAR